MLSESDWLSGSYLRDLIPYLSVQRKLQRTKAGRRKMRLYGLDLCRLIPDLENDKDLAAGIALAKAMILGAASEKDASQMRSRLREIPDGEWSETYLLGGLPDRRTRRLRTVLLKEGDVLVFSNEGTDAQLPTGNGTYCAFRSAAMAVLGLPNEVADIVAAGRADELEQVPGIGKSLASTIAGYLTTQPSGSDLAA